MKKQKPKKKPKGNYKIGYAAPPHEHNFPKGKSGNPKGRPRKPKTAQNGIVVDIDETYNQLEAFTPELQKGSFKKRELEVQLKKASSKNLPAIKQLISTMEKYGAIVPPGAKVPPVVILPCTPELPFGFSLILLKAFGFPPWTKEEIEVMRYNYEKDRRMEERRRENERGQGKKGRPQNG